MQTLGIVENKEEIRLSEKSEELSFVQRQFLAEQTSVQRRFDWAFGVVLPIVCIAADPIVFRGDGGMHGLLLDEYKVGAYLLSSVSILTMAAWLLWGERLGELRPYISGLFLVGSVVSTLVGLIILPFSLLGLLLIIGVLGFTPFFSGFVYFRQGLRALLSSSAVMPRLHIYQAAILAALYAVVIPIVLNFR